MQFEITDELEIGVMFTKKNDESHLLKTIIYFEDMNNHKNVYAKTNKYKNFFSMNSDYLIFYTEKTIKYFDLKGEFYDKNLIVSKFSID